VAGWLSGGGISTILLPSSFTSQPTLDIINLCTQVWRFFLQIQSASSQRMASARGLSAWLSALALITWLSVLAFSVGLSVLGR
jgi:hypothetical protein